MLDLEHFEIIPIQSLDLYLRNIQLKIKNSYHEIVNAWKSLFFPVNIISKIYRKAVFLIER